MLSRDEILAVYAAGPEAVVALVEQLQAQLLALTERAVALEARCAKDSHNSHRPPASDGLARKTRNLRQKSGKKPGGQPGRPGSTLSWSEHLDRVVTHAPDRCARYGAPLVAEAETGCQHRQVVGLPPLQLAVTEHRALQRAYPHCQAITRAPFPPAVTQAVQYGPGIEALAVYLAQYQLLPWERARELLADLFGQAPGEGSLATSLATCFERLAPVEAGIREAIRAALVVQMDQTGVQIAGKIYWLPYAGAPTLALYAWLGKRGRAGIEAVGVLPEFAGTRVHDA